MAPKQLLQGNKMSLSSKMLGVILCMLSLQASANSTDASDFADDMAAVVVANQTMSKPTQDRPISINVHDVTSPKVSARSISHDKLILNEPVVDAAHILSASEKAHLSEQLRALYDDKLAQAALVIIPSTQGMPIFDYAMALADRWQLGHQDTDEGLLIVVAINDRNLYILTGYGLEGVLPDAIVSRIIRNDITPSFKTGQYAQGLSAAIGSISERLRADPQTLQRQDINRHANDEDGAEIPLMGLFIFGFVIGSFLTSFLGRLLGATMTAGGVIFFGLMFGTGLMIIPVALILWLFLLLFKGGSGGSGRGGGGFVIPPTGGGFGGSFGSGGFSGGGGGFGGGGAGGSW
ncbi:TPM domain-containing protein [Moraxella oculi]|uniref:TPM domain-containing protein n=1 Tax=Moraxella oculi TaxID=2940516 RepID=A0ABW8U5R3_9GAMM